MQGKAPRKGADPRWRFHSDATGTHCGMSEAPGPPHPLRSPTTAPYVGTLRYECRLGSQNPALGRRWAVRAGPRAPARSRTSFIPQRGRLVKGGTAPGATPWLAPLALGLEARPPGRATPLALGLEALPPGRATAGLRHGPDPCHAPRLAPLPGPQRHSPGPRRPGPRRCYARYWRAVERLRKRPSPFVPVYLPPSITTLPRDSTISLAPCTSRPS